MAVIFAPVKMPQARKKHPDIAGDYVLGRSRGGYGTKIYLATDGKGFPFNLMFDRRASP
ncbi:hypothetical protein KKI94_14160 [Xenorhabdus bovienii]|nr:hypothetical protein [Xenorhabdus bovienii]